MVQIINAISARRKITADWLRVITGFLKELGLVLEFEDKQVLKCRNVESGIGEKNIIKKKKKTRDMSRQEFSTFLRKRIMLDKRRRIWANQMRTDKGGVWSPAEKFKVAGETNYRLSSSSSFFSFSSFFS